MRSTFFGIELARRALFSQQRAMDVASHNIANANNPAYSRQRAEMVATAPYAPAGMEPAGVAGQVGTGAWVEQIVRLRDVFLDDRIRRQNSLAGDWQVRRDVLEQIEKVFNEPSDNGLRVVLDKLWTALEDLSDNPDSYSVREVVLQHGRVLTDTVRTTFSQLEALRVDLDRTVETKVAELNGLAQRVAELNRQISQIAASGQNPNDLMDARDSLIEEMSRLAAVTVTIRPAEAGSAGGERVAVSVGGLTLVDGQVAHRLVMEGKTPNRTVRWESEAGPVVGFSGGEIGAYLQMRGTRSDDPSASTGYVPELMRDFDAWARELFQAFNDRHDDGNDLNGAAGGPFFVAPVPGQWAANTAALDPTLTPEGIAAARAGYGPGDGGNAIELAGLKSDPLAGLGGVSPSDYFASLIGSLGVSTQEAQTMSENQELVVDHLQTVRESISGVSLDEEMADLIRFEHAYGAAARVMTSMDELLDTLINRTGVVGR